MKLLAPLSDIAISYFVTLGAQLVAFNLLGIDAPLLHNLLLGAVFTIVSIVLGRFWSPLMLTKEADNGHEPAPAPAG